MVKKKYKNTKLHAFDIGGAMGVTSNYSSLGNQYRNQGLFPYTTNSINTWTPTATTASTGNVNKQSVARSTNLTGGTSGSTEDSGGNALATAGQIGGLIGMFDSLAQSATNAFDSARAGVNSQPQVIVEGILGGQSGSHLKNMWNTGEKTAAAINYINKQGTTDFDNTTSENLLAEHAAIKPLETVNIDTRGKELEDFVFDPASWLLTKALGIRESASKRQQRVNDAINAVNIRQNSAFEDAVANYQKRQARNVLANYSAFGGPLFGYNSDGALGYDLAKERLNVATLRALGDQSRSSTASIFDKGGPMFSNFDMGISIINAGGTHEENPLGGVPMGIAPDGKDNIVEEGESIYKNYVFSNRLPVPQAIRNKYKMRSTTFSDMFKEYLDKNGIDERENDPIAQNGLRAFASELMISQEELKAKKAAAKMAHSFDTGGKIIHDRSKNKENYFNDLYQEGSDYMKALSWYNDPAHTKERDALIAAINAGSFDTDNEKINGFTVTPDNWYALATDYKKGPVHNAILNRMNAIKKMDMMTPITIPNEVNPIMTAGPDGRYQLGYGPWTGKEGPQGLLGVSTIDNTAAGNTTNGNGAASVTSPESTIGNRARMAGLFANLGTLGYNLFDPYKPGVLDEIGNYVAIKGTPLGNYVPDFHTDTRYNSNQLAQQAAATRNAIMNTTAPNRYATLLGSDYNAQVAQGDVLRKDAIADYEALLKSRAFNRETDQYNSQLGFNVARANQEGRRAYENSRMQQEQFNLNRADAHKRAKDAAIGVGISNLVDWINANNRETDNLAMVGALRDSGALSSNEAMDLLYDYLAGVKPNKKNKKGGRG